MAISHEPTGVAHDTSHWSERLLVPEMWASLAIIVMWLAVLFDAIYGPNIVSTSGAGVGSSTVLPSSVVVALFAFLGTWVVARHGFRRNRGE